MGPATLARPTSPRAWTPSLGAWPDGEGTRFRVWAPKARTIEVVVERQPTGSFATPLARAEEGYFSGSYRASGQEIAIATSSTATDRFPTPRVDISPRVCTDPQRSSIPAVSFGLTTSCGGLAPEDLVVYKLHIGTFSPEATFEGATQRLNALRDLGVTAIEPMPVADFAGERNWGYDGVDLFAPARCYGTPDDLRRLVNEAHRLGMGVILDVVYNHFGPSGNYVLKFSKHYLSHRRSAWAACVNLDEVGGEQVRDFLIENALHWLHEYHIDGLRLDATDALHDDKPPHFLAVLAERVHASVPGRWVPLIAEDSRNLDIMIRPRDHGGWGLDAVWADDFHHQMRRLLAGDDDGYYRDYSGTTADLAATINQGWFFTGQYSAHQDKLRGTDTAGIPPRRFVVCIQNHDQVGNRPFGDRLHHTIEPASYRAASALLLMLPQTPLLFMGQEWAATSPFQYFTDHEPEIGKLVTEARRNGFGQWKAFADPRARAAIPDPQAATTFEASKLDWSERDREPHASTLRLYRSLLALRRSEPALKSNRRADFQAVALDEGTILLLRAGPDGVRLAIVVRLRGSGIVEVAWLPGMKLRAGQVWRIILTTEDMAFAPEPSLPRPDFSGPVTVLRFAGPAAVVLRAGPCDEQGQ